MDITQVVGDHRHPGHHHTGHPHGRVWEHLTDVPVPADEFAVVQHAYVHEETAGAEAGWIHHAVECLRRGGRGNVLVLVGRPGTGRRTAALRVLHDTGLPYERIRELIPDWDRPGIGRLPHRPRHGFLLDLGAEEELPEDFCRGLAEYRDRAAESETFLILLVTPSVRAPGLPASLPRLSHALPSARRVVGAHLRHLGSDRSDWLAHPAISGLLGSGSTPGDAVRLARIIVHAPENRPKDEVAREYRHWTPHLIEWFGEHTETGDLRERALLIAAALLEGAPTEVVLEAADRLFGAVGGELPPGGALAGRDLSARLGTIGAVRDEREDTLSLAARRPGLPDAVLAHVWRERPGLREAMLTWAVEVTLPGGPAAAHTDRVAGALTRLAGGPAGEAVSDAVEGWILDGRAGHRRLAVEVLGRLAVAPGPGPAVRRRLRAWCERAEVADEMAEAVSAVCAGAFGRRYPRVALTRLRLLISRTGGRGAEAVAAALRTLAADPRHREAIFAEMVERAESGDPRSAEEGARGFLTLVDPGAGSADAFAVEPSGDFPPSALLIRGWRAAWRHPATAERTREVLQGWLDSPRLPDDLAVDVVAGVIEGRLGEPGVAELLVGPDRGDGPGHRRRTHLFRRLRLDPEAPATPGAPPGPPTVPGPAPSDRRAEPARPPVVTADAPDAPDAAPSPAPPT
ncbi:hypothetical protein GCM10027160_45490 [Streptomyces calidiresistens]|uniref:Uncharacterized protein n=1 Tax=Streptomyces calidiresistens TaxID=1485586 RepID=A0A7W3T0L6_9ACTN|nr:hypothetical protein [Streptomyces calidiresistens]MBB0228779.1 hypothetical protein [Streptomyces calidiresistens]